jgi:hypothetical protein
MKSYDVLNLLHFSGKCRKFMDEKGGEVLTLKFFVSHLPGGGSRFKTIALRKE